MATTAAEPCVFGPPNEPFMCKTHVGNIRTRLNETVCQSTRRGASVRAVVDKLIRQHAPKLDWAYQELDCTCGWEELYAGRYGTDGPPASVRAFADGTRGYPAHLRRVIHEAFADPEERIADAIADATALADLLRQLRDMTEARDVLAARLEERENQP